jgi:hypothetical protein
MSDELRIEFDWLDCETGSELDRALAASIGVAVGAEYITRLDDLGAKTVRNQILASAWHLANWFVANWWRLRWEPAPTKWWEDVDWRIAHCLAAAGGGYVWPNAIFASDGDSMEIAAKPKSKGAHFEPVHYIGDVQARITAAEFEQKVDAFMEGVLSRMQALKVQDECLPSLWAEILNERSDAELSQQRKLEAMAGFDPDQAPAELLENLLEDQDNLGKSALAEVAAEARHKTGDTLQIIRELGRPGSRPKPGRFRVQVPQLPISPVADEDGRPWQKAASLARLARGHWGFDNRPIDDRALADLLSADATVFSDNSIVPSPMPLGLRTEKSGTFDIYFNRPSNTTRRFAASRLLGDYLYFSNQERLLPATGAKTSRQKFQRSFAQEFLCPIDALLEKIRTKQPDEDDISEAAAYFHVSPLMVRTTLVNNGQLEREALTWAD